MMTGIINQKRYGKLLEETLPRRISTEKENDYYLSIVEKMMDQGAEHLSPEESILFDLLVLLIEDFESRAYPLPKIPTNERIKYLLREENLKQKDLLPIFGSEGIISEVINGKRGITVGHARALARFFKMPVEVFV